MTVVTDLGVIAGMIRSATQPTNESVFWYDTNTDIQKYFNVNTSMWEPIAGASSTLAATLLAGSTTSGTNITITSGDRLSYDSAGFDGDLVATTLTANRLYTLPDQSGTVAMVSDVPTAFSLATVLASSNLTSGNNIQTVAGDVIKDQNGEGRINLNNSANNNVLINAGGTGITNSDTAVNLVKDTSILLQLGNSSTAEASSLTVNPTGMNLGIQQALTPSYLMNFVVNAVTIASIEADTNDLKISALQSNDRVSLYGGAHRVISAVNNGRSYIEADRQLTFTENVNTSISGNELDANGHSILRWDRSVAAQTITVNSITTDPLTDGGFLIVINDSNDNLAFMHDNVVATDKILTLDETTITIKPTGTAVFIYNSTLEAWLMLSATQV